MKALTGARCLYLYMGDSELPAQRERITPAPLMHIIIWQLIDLSCFSKGSKFLPTL